MVSSLKMIVNEKKKSKYKALTKSKVGLMNDQFALIYLCTLNNVLTLIEIVTLADVKRGETDWIYIRYSCE